MTKRCETCGGTGVDDSRATIPMILSLVAYVAAMFPCPDCGGTGEVESTHPVYVATMRTES